MIILKEFELNSKIELISDKDESSFGTIYDIDEDKIYISITSDDSQMKILRKGDSIRCLVFNSSTGIEFYATVTDRISGDFSIYELSDFRDFNEIQRRMNVRVQYSMPLYYADSQYLINLDREYLQENIDSIRRYFNEGLTWDLSAGGVRFSCSKNFTYNQELLYILDLEKESMVIRGRIVHKEIQANPKKTNYIYGAKFIDISEEQSETIIRYLFILMRRNRVK